MGVSLRRLSIALVAWSLTSTTFAAERLPVEAFSRLPKLDDVQLSPSGRFIAYLVNHEGDYYLTTQTVGESDHRTLVRSSREARIGWFGWANDDWLLVSAEYAFSRQGVKTMETRLMRIRREGSKLEIFFDSVSPDHSVAAQIQDSIVSLLPDDPEHILVELDVERSNQPTVFKVDVASGDREQVLGFRPKIRAWMTDTQDRVRLGVGYDDGVYTVIAREPEGKKWKELWSYTALREPGIHPLGFDLDPDRLYVRALHEGRWAIFAVDLADPALEKTLVAHDPEYDIEGSLIRSAKTRDVVGVYHRGSTGERIYWESTLGEFERLIDEALPRTTNYLVDFSRDERRYVVFSISDVDPGRYYYGDRDSEALTEIGARYPELDDAPLSGKEPIRYDASDGVTIEGYLTCPWGDPEPPWPTIVLPHGGPAARDYGGFDFMSEFLASRGFAVLQMNFRGSSGYGWEFESAAFKDVGGRMQDDVTDGAKWMIESGLADPERMCIAGGSYGGFAALFAAVKTPDLFRCAISINGVTDWTRLVRQSRYYVGGEAATEQFGKASDLKDVSPVRRAAEIKIPILLIHGADDRVVDVDHSRRMNKALRKQKKVYRYVELEHGRHALDDERNRTIALREIEAFLDEHAGGQGQAKPGAAIPASRGPTWASDAAL